MSLKIVKWYFDCHNWRPTKEQWIKSMSCVEKVERDRINRYVYKEDCKTALIGQIMILKYVSANLDIESNRLKLKRTNHGRPQLCKHFSKTIRIPNVFDFNISHSGNYCILGGIAGFIEDCSMTIGVDITKIVSKRNEELDRFLYLMSKREFLPEEWSLITNSKSDAEKCINFTRLWCLKESFIKSNGFGLSFGLNRINFCCKDFTTLPIRNIVDSTMVKLDGCNVENWKFLETAIDEDHLSALGLNLLSKKPQKFDAVCHNIEGLQDSFQKITIDKLIDELIQCDDADSTQWDIFNNKNYKTHVQGTTIR